MWLLDHLWAPVSAVVMGVWTHLGGKFRRLDKEKLDREDFDKWVLQHESIFSQHVQRTERMNEERRQTEIKLFDKLDDLKTIILERRAERRAERRESDR